MKYSENENIELKREYTPEIKKEIIAFANTNGGYLYIGISDNGKIEGLANSEKVLQQVIHIIRDGIRPDLTMFTNCRIKAVEGKKVIEISVVRGTARPYYLSEKGLKPSGVYVRHATSSNPASEEAIRKMIKETDGDRFELTRSMEQELTFEAAKKEFAKRKIEFGKNQMKNLGIINADGLYTNLGLLLSDQCAHTIKIACFEGGGKSEFKDRREFEGSILQQLHDSYEYINIFNKLHATYSGLERIDRRDYPEVAIREALLNAIVHRDYSFSGSTLISIFEDHIEFVSLGGLVSGLSIDDIINRASQARNEKLANIFYRLKLVEAYGTGIVKIMESYKRSASMPKLKATGNAFNISIFNLNLAISNRAADSNDNINEQWKEILNSIAAKGSLTRFETEKILGIGQTRAHVLLKAMIDAGMIKTVGNGKKRRYIRK